MDCGKAYYNKCDYKTSICDCCLMAYNYKEFDIFINARHVGISVRHFTINNWEDVYEEIRGK